MHMGSWQIVFYIGVKYSVVLAVLDALHVISHDVQRL